MINTMTGSPEMQPLMTVGRTAGGHPGLSARRKNRPNRNRVERLPTRHLVERFYAQRHAHPSIGRCGTLTVRTIARGALDMSRLPDKIILA
jgi:hypothetical protein